MASGEQPAEASNGPRAEFRRRGWSPVVGRDGVEGMSVCSGRDVWASSIVSQCGLFREHLVSGAAALQKAFDEPFDIRLSVLMSEFQQQTVIWDILKEENNSLCIPLRDMDLNITALLGVRIFQCRVEHTLRLCRMLVSTCAKTSDPAQLDIAVGTAIVDWLLHLIRQIFTGTRYLPSPPADRNLSSSRLYPIPRDDPVIAVLLTSESNSICSSPVPPISPTEELDKLAEWLDMCLSSAIHTLHDSILSFSLNRTVLSLRLSDAASMLNSSVWQAQLLALVILHGYMVLPAVGVSTSTNDSPIARRPTRIRGVTSNPPTARGPTRSLAQSSSTQQLPDSTSTGSRSIRKSVSAHASRKSVNSEPNSSSVSSQRFTDSSANELQHLGALLPLTYLMLHSRSPVRHLAARVLSVMCDASPSSSHASSSPTIRLSIGLSCYLVEQGVIPLLEFISAGLAIHDLSKVDIKTDSVESIPYSFLLPPSSDSAQILLEKGDASFPETVIRESARKLLKGTAEFFVSSPSARLQLITNLEASGGHHSLSVNTFVGVLLLSAHNPKFGGLFWYRTEGPYNMAISITAVTNNPFLHLFHRLTKDAAGISQVMEVLRYCVEAVAVLLPTKRGITEAIRARSSVAQTRMTTPTIPGADTSETANLLVTGLLYRVAPIVMVGPQGRLVKMVCPQLFVIEEHCPKLADLITKQHKIQLENAVSILLSSSSSSANAAIQEGNWRPVELEIKALHAELDESLFLKLLGDYNLWQEVFSHMSDEYLLSALAPKMGLSKLLEVAELATRYHMSGLVARYTQVLITRINDKTILSIFRHAVQPSVGSLNESVGYESFLFSQSLHCGLSAACIRYLQRDWDFCVRRKSPQEMSDIIRCLLDVVFHFLV